jgi:hypothetical protein
VPQEAGACRCAERVVVEELLELVLYAVVPRQHRGQSGAHGGKWVRDESDRGGRAQGSVAAQVDQGRVCVTSVELGSVCSAHFRCDLSAAARWSGGGRVTSNETMRGKVGVYK